MYGPVSPGCIAYEESPMKNLFFVVSLIAALIATPVIAQQGPAGVPGAPGLAPPPVVVAAPPAEPAKASPAPAKCGKTKSGQPTKACKPKKAAAPTCSSSTDPARCEQHRKTRELCKSQPERDYRQCLRDNLSPPK